MNQISQPKTRKIVIQFQKVKVPVTMKLAFGNGGDCNMSHVGHACQSLSSEPHRLYGL